MPSKREDLTVTVIMALFLLLTSIFIGLRSEHLLMAVLYLVLLYPPAIPFYKSHAAYSVCLFTNLLSRTGSVTKGGFRLLCLKPPTIYNTSARVPLSTHLNSIPAVWLILLLCFLCEF